MINGIQTTSISNQGIDSTGLRKICHVIMPVVAFLITILLGPSIALAEVQDSSDPSARKLLRVVYFHSPTCEECRRVKLFLAELPEQIKSKIIVEYHGVDDINEFNELFKYEKQYAVTVAAPPAIFVGDKALVGQDKIMTLLASSIHDSLNSELMTFDPVPANQSGSKENPSSEGFSEIQKRFESFGPMAVALAGLIDGVNPCAFTTIVFFLSMLAYLKKSRREMMLVGGGFAVGMFVAYFLLGLGLLGAVKAFSVSHGFSRGLSWGVALFAFALAAWSLMDAIRYMRTKDTKSITLGLPRGIKNRIHKVIRTGLTTRGLVIGSLSVGFLVSILESLCTGQVYLPTIVFMTQSPGMKSAALSYLLLYNLMFIVPLLGILVMTYYGVQSETIGNMLRKRLALAKFGMSGLFAGLAIFILVSL